jgi:hypothetical protein
MLVFKDDNTNVFDVVCFSSRNTVHSHVLLLRVALVKNVVHANPFKRGVYVIYIWKISG